MTFNVISDMHINFELDGKTLDWNIFDPAKLKEADYLVIAGDIGLDDTYEKALDELRKKTEGKFKDILWIKGNHDYYSYGETKEKTPDNVTFEVVDGDFAIFGTTLWTSISEPRNEWAVWRGMNDFNWIPKWNVNKWKERYAEENAWLKQRFDKYRAEGKKVIIVTHHNPGSFMAEKWRRNNQHLLIEAAYFVDDNSCQDIKPDLWICGHKHKRFDETFDGTRYYRNPIGYHGDWYGPYPQLKTDHWYDSVVEVK